MRLITVLSLATAVAALVTDPASNSTATIESNDTSNNLVTTQTTDYGIFKVAGSDDSKTDNIENNLVTETTNYGLPKVARSDEVKPVDVDDNLVVSETTNYGIPQDAESSNVKAERDLQKRYITDIPVPQNIPDPKPIVIGGVVVAFNMVRNWVNQNGRNVFGWKCKSITFTNNTHDRKALNVMAAGGTKLVKNYVMSEGRIWSYTPEHDLPGTIDVSISRA